MTKDGVKAQLERSDVMRPFKEAFLAGRLWVQESDGGNWALAVDDANFNFPVERYRIAAEPVHRPYNEDEMHALVGTKVLLKASVDKVTLLVDKCRTNMARGTPEVRIDDMFYDAEALQRLATHPDGTPLGVLVEP